MSIVPKKYHTFISPPLRRVFLDAREDNSREVIENLNAENAALKERVTSLERDKVVLQDRCDSAQSALTRLEDKQNLDHLRAEYDALKSRARNRHGLTLFLTCFFIFVSVKLYSRSAGPQ